MINSRVKVENLVRVMFEGKVVSDTLFPRPDEALEKVAQAVALIAKWVLAHGTTVSVADTSGEAGKGLEWL